MKYKIPIIIAAVTLTVAIGVGVWFVMSDKRPQNKTAINSATSTVQDNQVQNKDKFSADPKDWKTYKNTEVGISFRYPDIFEREDMSIRNGDTGRLFIGVLEFFPNHWISFGGATEDYRYPQGGSLIGTLGYEKQEEQYFVKFLWGKQKISPSEFWPVNSGKNQALVVRNSDIDQILAVGEIAAFVNIPHSPFPGIVFSITPTSLDGSVSEKDVQILRQIISSITFEE